MTRSRDVANLDGLLAAKGDIYAATAAATPARFGVGTDFAFLQADSTTGTGLVWNNADWVKYTPTITAFTGTFTTVFGQGRYLRVGKSCLLSFTMTITTNGTAAIETRISLPFTASAGGTQTYYANGVVRDYAVTGRFGFAYIAAGANTVNFADYTGAYLGGNGFVIAGSIVYEVA